MVFQDEFAIRYGEALFHRINQWCKQHHATLLVLTTGFNAFYPGNLHDPTEVFLTQAKPFFLKEGIAYYDMALPFKKATTGKTFQLPRNDHHPNELGAKMVAQTSWPWVRQRIKKMNSINFSD